MSDMFVFRELAAKSWWRNLVALERVLDKQQPIATRLARRASRQYANLVVALIEGRHASLSDAMAAALLEGEPVLAGEAELPVGLREAALLDLELLKDLLEVDWQERAEALCHRELPPLCGLAPIDDGHAATSRDSDSWAKRLKTEEPHDLLAHLQSHYREAGTGLLARYVAFKWASAGLEGIRRPAGDRLEELVGLEPQLERLTGNVERFLDARPALHTLLYGPRGSGKSTAVRGLLTRYRDRGLRLVEVGPESLGQLPELSERLSEAPYRFLVYVDDLSFGSGDAGYQPLKTLLEGSVSARPANVLLIATSNRRHLVRESFSDRPMPDSDDVHGWDTTNERLALADRFGLTITFPAADQRKYLEVVRELARGMGVEGRAGELDEAAIRFADWGNGYSGRTARQFVDTLR